MNIDVENIINQFKNLSDEISHIDSYCGYIITSNSIPESNKLDIVRLLTAIKDCNLFGD